jgi:hypothetical protein
VFRRRRLPLLLVGTCLILASGAAAAEPNTFTATSTPTHVKPSTPALYTITLTNGASSDKEADRARIDAPVDFLVAPATVQGSAGATAECVASQWVPDVNSGTITLVRPGGMQNTRLCPGATLTVQFSATSAASEGPHTWVTTLFRGDDAFVLSGSQPTVEVDGTAPAITIDQKPTSLTNSRSASFTFAASDPTQCKLDEGAFAPCTSPQNYSNLADGLHTFTVQATDAAGNSGQNSYAWTIDATPPTVAITGTPGTLTNSRSASFTFSATDPAQCKLDDATFAPCTSPQSYAELADGSHTFTVKATDAAGNTGQASHAWTVDATPPTVEITGGKPGNPTNSKTAAFTFTTSESGTMQCKLDAGAFAPCTSPESYNDLADGEHKFTVTSTDAAGNTGQDSHTWTIDSAAPTVTIGDEPANPTKSRSAHFTFTAEAAPQCSLDNAPFTPCTSPWDYDDLPDGPHTFVVKATDAAGNTGQAIYAWRIDNVAPAVIITQKPNDPSNVKSPTFSFVVNEGGTTTECKLDAASFLVCPSPKSYSNLPDGQHLFTVRATDGAGNTSQAAYTWRLETKFPIATLIDTPRNPSTTTSARFEFSPSRPQATLECQLDGGAWAPCTTPAVYTGLSQGPHTFAVRAKDAAGTGPPTSYAWTIDSVGPTAAITQTPGNPTSSRSATFAFSADEAGSFACDLDGGGYGPCGSPLSYQGLGDGVHTFTVTPRDAIGNTGVSASYSWRVDGTAPETALASAPAARTTALSATFTFSANEPAGYECKLDTAGFTPCSSPKTYTGLRRAAHVFDVRAIDAAGNVDATPAVHRWTIAAPTRSRRTKTASALLSPRPGARVTSPPLLRWRRVARAAYYNVQLFRGSTKILSSWPVRTRLQLRAQWTYLGRQRRLTVGKYRWYVWPGYGKSSVRRYGRLLGGSTFTVTARARH